MRTIPNIHNLLLPLEDAITQHLIPVLTGRRSCSAAEREILALPVRLGGLGLTNPATLFSPSLQASEMLTKPLVDLILAQDIRQSVDRTMVLSSKKRIRRLNRFRNTQQANSVLIHLTPELRRCVQLAQEKGLPHGFLSCLWKSTGFFSTKENLEMLCA